MTIVLLLALTLGTFVGPGVRAQALGRYSACFPPFFSGLVLIIIKFL